MQCQAFEFKHLPMPGGLYDQNPDLLEKFIFIMQEQQKHEKAEEERQKNRGMGPTRTPKGGPRMSSRPAH